MLIRLIIKFMLYALSDWKSLYRLTLYTHRDLWYIIFIIIFVWITVDEATQLNQVKGGPSVVAAGPVCQAALVGLQSTLSQLAADDKRCHLQSVATTCPVPKPIAPLHVSPPANVNKQLDQLQ